jgi:mRNA deadenylase 3'-5' endonuclease subunit Ccr4
MQNKNEDETKLQKQIYKLIQWNLLAKGEKFCNKSSFPNVSENSLSWENRKLLFRQILKELNSDFYCFEEVDDYENIGEIFENKKFSSIYYSKESNPQGIAVFYNNEKFDLLESEKIFLNSNSIESEGNLIIKSSQFFSVYFFKEKDTNCQKIFCLLVTHLKAKKEFEEIRKNQIKHICNYINFDENYLRKLKDYNCDSLILCGDFNTEPDSESLSYLLNYKLMGKFEKFVSSYNLFDKNEKDFLECSTFKIREKEYYRVIDYIFYAGNIKLNKVINIPNKNSDEWKHILDKGLPSEEFPSDHHYLGIEFSL